MFRKRRILIKKKMRVSHFFPSSDYWCHCLNCELPRLRKLLYFSQSFFRPKDVLPMMTSLANIQIFSLSSSPDTLFWKFEFYHEVYLQVITCSCSGLWTKLNLRNPSSWLWLGACCFLLFRRFCLGNNRSAFSMHTEEEFGCQWCFWSVVHWNYVEISSCL